jgi:hypothetical protein
LIRIQSLAFGADKSQMMLQLGWWDPDMKMLRTKMTSMAMETLKAFQTHMRLKGGTFDVEYMVKFCLKRSELGPDLCKIIVFDGGGGVGAEWEKPSEPKVEVVANPNAEEFKASFDIEEFKTRIRGYTYAQLINVSTLAENNGHPDVVLAVTNELERRRV